MFKFLEEKELRFKCSLLLIPRSLNNSPVELPKSNITDLFQFINPHKRFKDVIETITLTKWIKVSEQLAITNYDKVFPTPTPLIEAQFDPQEQKKGIFVQSAEHSVEGSIHKTAPISKIAFDDGLNNDLFEYQDGDLISSANLNANEQGLYQLRNSKVSKAIAENNKSAAKQTNFNKKDWLLENLLLNGTNTSEKIIKDLPKHSGCAVSSSNGSILINKLRNKLSEKQMCSWRVLNSAILIWSIASVLVWLALLTRALYKYSYQSRESYLQSLTSNTSPTSTTNASTNALSTVQPLSSMTFPNTFDLQEKLRLAEERAEKVNENYPPKLVPDNMKWIADYSEDEDEEDPEQALAKELASKECLTYDAPLPFKVGDKVHVKAKLRRDFDEDEQIDEDDWPGTTNMLLAVSNEDIQQLHSPNVFYQMRHTQLLQKNLPSSAASTSAVKLKTLEIRAHKVKVPAERFTYWCQSIELDNKVKRQKHHIIKYEPIITKGLEHVIHHMEETEEEPMEQPMERMEQGPPAAADEESACPKPEDDVIMDLGHLEVKSQEVGSHPRDCL
uniref:Copper type II ascorbate-dependent monooxygenase N-terminal domain-containing protein n=1 Tax=Ditylenchus dipsaci TaxID=166011 RepID=A0A915D9E8_9BILA